MPITESTWKCTGCGHTEKATTDQPPQGWFRMLPAPNATLEDLCEICLEKVGRAIQVALGRESVPSAASTT